MEYRKRRLMSLILTFVGVVFASAIAFAGAVSGDSERIDGYRVSAVVRADGVAAITEVIDYDFGPRERHGIFRDVPGLNPRAAIEVTSPTAPTGVFILGAARRPQIRVGDPDKTVRGRHRYILRYPLHVGFGDDRISWNAIGADWDFKLRDVEVQLVADRELEDVRATRGASGSWDACPFEVRAPGHVVVQVASLDVRHGITISARLGRPLDAPPVLPAAPEGAAEDPGASLVSILVAAALAAVLATIVVVRGMRRAGLEQVWAGGSVDAAFGPRPGEAFEVRRVDHDELAHMASIEFVPPREVTPWQGGIILSEHVAPQHKVAWLLDRAIAGEIRIEGSGKDLALERDTGSELGLAPLDTMFGGRQEVQLGKYDKQFASGWEALDKELSAWHAGRSLLDADGDRRRSRAGGLAALGLFLGLTLTVAMAVLAARFGVIFLVGVTVGAAAIAAAFACLANRWELRVRTPQGSALWIRIESFRRFLEKSDAKRVKEAAEKGMLLLYTAWAVALGEVAAWSDAVSKAGIEGDVGPTAVHLSMVAPSLGYATSAAAVAPGSSGGGGGGSVGGGAGGGGGGSW